MSDLQCAALWLFASFGGCRAPRLAICMAILTLTWAVRHTTGFASTSGWVFIMNQAAISWGSKKQKSVAVSSCEAEIVAASEASTEAAHLDRLAREFDQMSEKPLSLATDNKAAQDVSYNPEHHTKMKHVERRHFFVRECVEEHASA